MDDTIRGGGYTNSSTCTSTTCINPTPSPCTTQKRKNPRVVINTPTKVVKPIAINPIKLKVRDVEQLKEPGPTEYSTSSYDRHAL